MNWIDGALIAVCLVGYAFFLGWWARGKALSDGEKLVRVLSRVTMKDIAEGEWREFDRHGRFVARGCFQPKDDGRHGSAPGDE
ncbi:MAG: hypothetical protein ACOC8P_00465 [Dichotomicrobium sp.]